MRRLLSTTTLLSLALAPVQPWPLLAQQPEVQLTEDGSVLAPDGTVLCTPSAEAACDPAAIANTLAPDPVAEAQRLADEAAAAEAEAQRLAAEAAAEAQRQAEEAAAAQPSDAPAQPPAEGTPSEPAAESASEAAPDPAPESSPQTDALPDASPATEPDIEPAAEPVVEPAPAPEPVPEPAAEAPAADSPAVTADPAPEPVPEPVDVPVVSAEETQVLTDILSNPELTDLGAIGAAAAMIGGAPAVDGSTAPATTTGATADAPAPDTPPAQVTVTEITEANTRSSAEEFAAAPQLVGENRKSGLSDLERAGLFALGALALGKVLTDGREVVSNSGDRVVVREPDGGYQVYKDDDTLLRRPGATVRTETYRDGSTRNTVERADGSSVVTIRDASGRVLRRAHYDRSGQEQILIDDLAPEERIDISTLPPPRADRVTISTAEGDAALKAALARVEAERLGRSFSLRQIREIPQVRALAATIDVDNITFDSGSSVIRPGEARKLADIGRIMDEILRDNPREVFLIEGHTDAVGSASSNLVLSDRRAESVALALTEYFAIPPENMVVQGYGESELRIDTQADERLNRRAAIRVVTPLMRTAGLR